MSRSQALQLLLTIAAGLLSAQLGLTPAAALIPPLPASFYGTVTVDGVDVPAGTPVSAWIAGVRYAETETFLYQGRAMYALDVPADDPATPEVEGRRPCDTIVFHIGELKAGQTAAWQGGTNTELHLTAAGPLVCGGELGCVVFFAAGGGYWRLEDWRAEEEPRSAELMDHVAEAVGQSASPAHPRSEETGGRNDEQV